MELLLSKLRKAHRFLRETNNELLSPIGNLVHVGGASGSRASRNVENGSGVSGVIRGIAHRGGTRGGGSSRGVAHRGGANGCGASRG